jgi:DNA-binding CsgD family transcriptional regulator
MLEASLTKPTENKGFQVEQLPLFDTKNVQRHLIKHRNSPDYRRINAYYKSPKQYQKERGRRRKALQLLNQGLSFGQIAKQLGVNRRTVYRDLSKTKRYLKGQINAKLFEHEQEQIRKHEQALAGLSTAELFKCYTDLMCLGLRAFKQRRFEKHNFNVLINLDDLTNGFPSIIPENKNSTMTLPYNFNFIAVKNGEKHVLGSWTMSKSEERMF